MYVRDLRHVSFEDIGLVGGKAASLGEMLSAGINVPPGFVVTTDAYHPGMTLELEKEILEEFDKLGVKRVAVRSSAVAEDSENASWAGQLESYLNITRDNLINSIKKCWQSIQSEHAQQYAKEHSVTKDKQAVAVVVQAMVDSDVSGVMFTANPLTNDQSEIVIEASYGLGETIVQGKVTPDNYVVTKKNFSVLKREINTKKIQLIFQNDKNTEIVVGRELQKLPAMSDSTLKLLAKLGTQIEKHYGSPQDIEWGVVKNELFILQSRPITTLGSKTATTQTNAKSILSGLGASPGIASGKVRVIESIENLRVAQEGEILVTPLTTPEFTEVFTKMAAVVTNSGGMASHAAIVSRELDIPAIVGTDSATQDLKSGQVVTVDGYSGNVYSGKVEIKVTGTALAEPDHVVLSTGNDIDDLVNSLVADPMDTREFWPLAPGSLMSYFDVDQAIDMYKKLAQLIKQGWSFETIAQLFQRAQLVRYFIVNSGLVGIKIAHGLKIASITTDDQVTFTSWLSEILKQFQPDDPYNLKGKNSAWSDKEATSFAKSHAWHKVDKQARELLNHATVQLFSLNWSFYGDYYGPIGHELHGPYTVPGDKSMLVREYFRAPTEIWKFGEKLPYDHLLIAQEYEGVDLYVNYSNRLLNLSPVSKHNISYHIMKDGREIDLNELQQTIVKVVKITKQQTAYVNNLPELDKVRKWAQLAYYAHKDFYLHFDKDWYNKKAVEWSINEFGDRFLVDEKLAHPENRPVEYRKKMWDPRNNYYPGKEEPAGKS